MSVPQHLQQQPQQVQPQLPNEITSWLYRVLSPEYQDANRTYSDVVQLLITYPSLRPRTSVYTDENGCPDLLLCLFGTVPARIANSVYRIPVEIWVPKTYPSMPPFAFVRPTSNMLIHPGNYVDTNGKCYHPYLSYWRDNTQSSNVTEFVNLMGVAFGKEPPVYSRPPNYQPPSQPQPPPLPPHPPSPSTAAPEYQRHSLSLSAQNSGNSMRNGSINSVAPAPLEPSLTGGGPPPRPPLPPQLHTSHVQPPQYVPLPGSSTPVSVVAPRPVHTVQPAPVKPIDIMDLPAEAGSHELSNGTPNTSSPLQTGTPPKLPPNPQKMQVITALNAAMTDITQRHEQVMINENDARLLQGAESLTWMTNALNNEAAELDRIITASKENESILQHRISQARSVIDDASQRPEPNIDDVVCAETVVYNQLYDLITEDHAIDDTIYVLSKALEKDRINLDTFLKHTRTLAREQFMKRALAQKITTQVGLA